MTGPSSDGTEEIPGRGVSSGRSLRGKARVVTCASSNGITGRR